MKIEMDNMILTELARDGDLQTIMGRGEIGVIRTCLAERAACRELHAPSGFAHWIRLYQGPHALRSTAGRATQVTADCH